MAGASGGSVFVEGCSSARLSQQWTEIVDPSGTVSYKNVSTGLCLRVIDRAISSASCNTADARQDFVVVASSYGQGYIYLVKINSTGTAADCYADRVGSTQVLPYSYTSTCIQFPAGYSWKKIAR